MSLSHSPKVVTNGLVFYYDMFNTQKSWRGKPTTNVIETDLTLYDKDNGCTVTKLEETYQGNPVYRVNFPAGTLPRIRTTFTYTAGQQFTGSIYHRVVSQGSGTPQLYFRENGFGTSYTSAPLNSVSWARTVITYTFPASGTSMFLLYQSDSSATVPTTIDFAMPQTELGAFATPFTTSTRSNTEAILDITGNNTVTINSLNYNSDGSISFLNNLGFSIPSIDFSEGQTIEIWLKPLESDGNRRNPYNQAYGGYGTWTHEPSGAINYYYGDAGSNNNPYYGHNSGFTVVQDEIACLCTTRDLTTSRWYKNGQGNNVYNHSFGALATDNNPIIVGNGYAGQYYGDIYSVKLYNRALSAEEVRQNFNAMKGRYGL